MNKLKEWAKKYNVDKLVKKYDLENVCCCTMRENKTSNVLDARTPNEAMDEIKTHHGKLQQSDMASLDNELQMQSYLSAQRY